MILIATNNWDYTNIIFKLQKHPGAIKNINIARKPLGCSQDKNIRKDSFMSQGIPFWFAR